MEYKLCWYITLFFLKKKNKRQWYNWKKSILDHSLIELPAIESPFRLFSKCHECRLRIRPQEMMENNHGFTVCFFSRRRSKRRSQLVCFATSCWAPMIYKVELGDGSCQKNVHEHDDFCLPKKLPVSSVWNRNVWWCVDLYYIILHMFFCNTSSNIVALFSPWRWRPDGGGVHGPQELRTELLRRDNRTSSLGQKKQPQPTLMVTGTMVKCMG